MFTYCRLFGAWEVIVLVIEKECKSVRQEHGEYMCVKLTCSCSHSNSYSLLLKLILILALTHIRSHTYSHSHSPYSRVQSGSTALDLANPRDKRNIERARVKWRYLPQKKTFLMGTHKRLGANSPNRVYFFCNHIFDPNLLRLIFSFVAHC